MNVLIKFTCYSEFLQTSTLLGGRVHSKGGWKCPFQDPFCPYEYANAFLIPRLPHSYFSVVLTQFHTTYCILPPEGWGDGNLMRQATLSLKNYINIYFRMRFITEYEFVLVWDSRYTRASAHEQSKDCTVSCNWRDLSSQGHRVNNTVLRITILQRTHSFHGMDDFSLLII